MLVLSKFNLLLFLILISVSIFGNDILTDHILKYNNLKNPEKELFKVDSNKLFYPKDFISNNQIKTTQIIRKISKKNKDITFIIFLATAFFYAILRITFVFNIYTQCSNFLKIKYRNIERYPFIKKSIIIIIYNLLLSFILYIVFIESKLIEPNSNNVYYMLSLLFIVVNIIKFFILWLVSINFNLKLNFEIVEYIQCDAMMIFSVISLPLLLLFTISILSVKHIIISILIVVFILIQSFKFIKLLYNNSTILLYNKMNTLIYFTAIEVIPLLLLAKIINKTILQFL